MPLPMNPEAFISANSGCRATWQSNEIWDCTETAQKSNLSKSSLSDGNFWATFHSFFCIFWYNILYSLDLIQKHWPWWNTNLHQSFCFAWITHYSLRWGEKCSLAYLSDRLSHKRAIWFATQVPSIIRQTAVCQGAWDLACINAQMYQALWNKKYFFCLIDRSLRYAKTI